MSPTLADNHDLISMKLYELTVDKTKEELEQEEEEEVTVLRVDNMQQFIGNNSLANIPAAPS